MPSTHYTTHYPDMINAELGLVPTSATAGGANDGSEVLGVEIDRQDYFSGVVAIPVTATLSEAETVTIDLVVYDAAESGGTYGSYKVADTVTLTGGTGGSTETALVELDLNLQGAKQFVQIGVTSTFSLASTDTADFAGVVNLTGAIENPV